MILPPVAPAAALDGAAAAARHRRRDHPRLGCQRGRTREEPRRKEQDGWNGIGPAGAADRIGGDRSHFFFAGPLPGGSGGSFSSG